MEEVFSAYVLHFLERKSDDNIYTLSAPPNNTKSMLKKNQLPGEFNLKLWPYPCSAWVTMVKGACVTQNILHLGSISPLVLFCFYFLFCIFCRETATCSLENLTCISFNKILTVCVWESCRHCVDLMSLWHFATYILSHAFCQRSWKIRFCV